jgi:hypothetical protein
MQPADTFTHAGIECAIYQDEDAGNPYTEWDQASRLLIGPSLARNYSLGQDGKGSEVEQTPDAVDNASSVAVACRYLRLMEGYAVVLPFTFQDYGSGGSRAWILPEDTDSADGYVVVDAETVAREWNDHSEHGTATERAENCARAEFGTFANWLEGDVYGFIVADGTPEEQSCWGFYGHDGMTEQPGADDAWTEARSVAEYAATERARREWWTRVYLLDPTPGPMPA